jgi:hypothetical protein
MPSLAEIVEQIKPQAEQAERRFALQSALAKLGGLGKHIATIKALIENPEYYSDKQWEKVLTSLEWLARRLTDVVERMEELRPLAMIDDPAGREEYTEHDF